MMVKSTASVAYGSQQEALQSALATGRPITQKIGVISPLEAMLIVAQWLNVPASVVRRGLLDAARDRRKEARRALAAHESR